jgi:hypothetical protein
VAAPEHVDVVDDAWHHCGVAITDDEARAFVGEPARQPIADAAEPGEDDDFDLERSRHDCR